VPYQTIKLQRNIDFADVNFETFEASIENMTNTDRDSEQSIEPAEKVREIKYRYSDDFLTLMSQLKSTLVVSTYAAGKVAVIGAPNGELNLSFHNFEQAMGLAVSPEKIAVGAKGQVWFLDNGGGLASQIAPAGKYEQCYLARSSLVTGNIHIHELAWTSDQLWVVNTLFSCLSTVQDGFSFVPRWKPPFITELKGEDRCHLNGFALENGQPKYVTMMAETNEAAGWRPKKAETGCVMDVTSNELVTRGLAMPHSPRIHENELYVLNSGLGTIEKVDRSSGQRDVIEKVPGYTRGLAMYGPFAFVGMSRIRETAVFGGVPIAEKREDLRCGVAVIDLRSGKAVAYLEFETGIEEVFDVQIIPGVSSLSLTGPFPQMDGGDDVWVVGNPD